MTYEAYDFRGDDRAKRKLYELEKEGKMYDSLFRIRISKEVVENLHNDPNMTLQGEEVQLKSVF
jgi:hypothetical protein